MAETSDTLSQDSPQKPSDDVHKQQQVPAYPSFSPLSQGDVTMFPVMYPALVPSLGRVDQEQLSQGAGLYAIPVLPSTGMPPVAGIPYNTLIPLTYNIPTTPSASEAVTGAGDNGQMGQQQQQHAQQLGARRQIVVRRFQIAFQLDLLLMLKLAAVIFLFNQDGSRQRLALLFFLATIVYLYQTGALAPLMRWISQAMHRAAAPPRPPRPALRLDPPLQQGLENAAAAEGQPAAEVNQRPGEDGNRVVENEDIPRLEEVGGNQWWGIVKEIQMIVFGFITSLLPGFHNIDHP